MKIDAHFLILSILLILIYPFNSKSQELTEIKEFGFNPGNLRMYAQISPGNEPKPLLVVLHGCTQDAHEIAETTGWNKLAEHYGFHVLYPEQVTKNNISGCFNWFKPEDFEGENGETRSVFEMISFTKRNYAIDTNRIYIYGVSAGAALSVAIMANYPDLFQAGSVLAGGPYGMASNPMQAIKAMTNPDELSPKELGDKILAINPQCHSPYPKLIVMHGKQDNTVNFRNSEELVKQWLYIYGCNSPDIPVTNYDGHSNIIRHSYTDDNQDEVVVFYEIDDLQHEIPIKPGKMIFEGGKPGKYSSDFGFHSTWHIARDLGLIK